MRDANRRVNEMPALKPIGGVLAAVVAGLGAPAAHAEPVKERVVAPPAPTPHVRAHYVDHTNDPAFEQDDTLILGPSEPAEPFAEAPTPARQPDLFDL